MASWPVYHRSYTINGMPSRVPIPGQMFEVEGVGMGIVISVDRSADGELKIVTQSESGGDILEIIYTGRSSLKTEYLVEKPTMRLIDEMSPYSAFPASPDWEKPIGKVSRTGGGKAWVTMAGFEPAEPAPVTPEPVVLTTEQLWEVPTQWELLEPTGVTRLIQLVDDVMKQKLLLAGKSTEEVMLQLVTAQLYFVTSQMLAETVRAHEFYIRGLAIFEKLGLIRVKGGDDD